MADDHGTVQKLAYQGLVNRIVRGLLRVPLISKGIGNHLITLYVVGRKSGRRYTVPVAYIRHDGGLLIGTPFGWARNLRTGDSLAVRYRGDLRTADVLVFTGEAEVVEAYGIIARGNHNFAGFNKIRLDDAGNPNDDDLHRAWAEGARVLRLTLR